MQTDRAGGTTFSLGHRQSNTMSNVLSGNGYTVTEDQIESGFEFVSIDCNVAANPSVGLTPVINGVTVTFNIDDEDDVLDCTYTNRELKGNINILKIDDAGSAPQSGANRLADATFTLYTNVVVGGVDTKGSPVSPAKTCTTNGDGECSMTDIVPGTYWVVETTTPAGYSTAPDQKVALGAGATASLTFVDPRKHIVVVLVCHMGSNTLAVTDVANGSSTKTSLSGAGRTAAQQAALCGLQGARWDNLEHADKSLTAKIGTAAHP